MLFNTLEFSIFLPLVFLIYWFVVNKNIKVQNLFLLFASYVFYGWWDYRFLGLIIFSSTVDFLIGLKLSKEEKTFNRKALLFLSLLINLGFLGFFKYYNFFLDSFVDAFTLFGSTFDSNRLNIILPVGISFYTFQTLSYSIDIYRKKMTATKDLIAFFAYVSFFPQLVAGPIERATNLLPQFSKKRKFEYENATDGLRQILWGLFKKVVVADNCATYVNEVFSNYAELSGSTLLLGAVFFAFQIYGDFSGYSDIAIGTSRLFGFNLMKNFAFPYFSRDISEFWRRWHISLSTWFRDYLYIPLGGSRGGMVMKIRNTFAIFLVSGFWHGANWTFLAWGFLNALYFLPLLLAEKNRINTNTVAEGKLLPSPKEFYQIIKTFLLISLAWVFFRSDTITDSFHYLKGIFSTSLFESPTFFDTKIFSISILSISILIFIEWIQRTKEHGLVLSSKTPFLFRWSVYIILVVLIFYFAGTKQEFIYFQF